MNIERAKHDGEYIYVYKVTWEAGNFPVFIELYQFTRLAFSQPASTIQKCYTVNKYKIRVQTFRVQHCLWFKNIYAMDTIRMLRLIEILNQLKRRRRQ